MIPSNPIGPSHTDEITKKVEGLSPAKRTLLDLRMKKKEAEAAVEGGIPHREGRQKAALSFAQQRLWFLQQLETESPAYNVYGSVKLKGRLNEEALRGSLKEIVRRHETLRTRFVEVEGRAMQVVGDGAEVELPIIELSGVQERERETLRLAIEEANIPFDLGQGPLLRGKLLRLGEEEHVLLLIVHHIVSDGWSVGVLVRELGVLYEAYAAGKESPLPELPIQYADYAEWQREYLQGEVQEELVVGTPIANRTRVETEELIGCFVNTLVLRVDASGNPRFCELLRRVKQVALEAYAHQDIPFEKLVEELQPKRDLSRTALFQVMFVLQNVPMAEMKLGGLTVSGVEVDHQVAKVDVELNRRANQLARRLRGWGVGPEQLVGLCMKRSLEMVVGLMGVLKAGGAYVPLEPDYPRERLEFMLKDTGVRVVLSEERYRKAVEGEGLRVLSLDTEWGDVAAESGEGVESGVQPENLAYVIYTSGSTGKPKGVMVEHRSVVNYTQAVRVRYDLAGPRSYGMLQPLTVDSSVTMLFPALLSGGCLHLISDQPALDAAALADYFNSHRIDCLKIAPSHLAALQTSSHANAILPQSLLVIGGETSRRDWAQSLVTMAPSCRMFNHYGPTETTVGVLTFPLTQESLKNCPARLLLGRPLANCVAYILDRHENPIPIGIFGELYVGGDCLARGYWNLPELTAAKFVPSPFCHHRGKLLYKTGDTVRYRPDGNIEFLGRADHQVKIRGFRIELGEIERALAAHPGIREVVALVGGDDSQHQRIVAYFVAHSEPVPTQGELREFLKQTLHAYMMPT